MNSKEQRIAKLNEAQQKRKKECIERTEKAIFKLLNANERISFGAIAREAGVSVSYLYKYPEVKQHIQEIRDKQVKQAKKLTKPQIASEKSKQAIIQQLRERINCLEWEKKELKKQSEKMTGELYKIGIKLDLFDRLQLQTVQQSEEIKKLKAELEATQNELSVCQAKLMENNSKVTSINDKLKPTTNNNQIDNNLKTRLSSIGIRLNSTLKKIIESSTQQEINNAISAVEEYLANGTKIKSKAGLLRKALEEKWTPNLTLEERKINEVTDSFSQWFKLAQKEGIVLASQGTKKGVIVLEPTGEWTPLTTMIEKGWTLEYLQERNKEKKC